MLAIFRLDVKIFRCNLCWKDDKTLIIGWADSIKVCCIRKRTEISSKRADLPDYYVEIGES